jgi:hypothetical protein
MDRKTLISEVQVDEPYKASLVNIYKDGAIVDAACCAADSELVGDTVDKLFIMYFIRKESKTLI